MTHLLKQLNYVHTKLLTLLDLIERDRLPDKDWLVANVRTIAMCCSPDHPLLRKYSEPE